MVRNSGLLILKKERKKKITPHESHFGSIFRIFKYRGMSEMLQTAAP